MAQTVTITGDKKLDAMLAKLSDKVGQRLTKYAMKAGVSKLSAAIRKAAPVGPTGNLKKSVGSRVDEKSKGIFEGKAGLNVGKNSPKRSGRSAPHSHLVALGTVARVRKTIGGRFGYLRNPTPQQLSTGTMPANSFVKTAAASAQGAVYAAMRKNFGRNLAKELSKLK